MTGWNGKFQAVGNGAWQGSIGYAAMAEALRRGYATSSTDTGHVGGSASFGMGHPEKVIDFAYRSEHEMAVTSKAVINAFYGSAPKFSYWNGCSAGGRQAMKEAQMFPADFDGIIAGSPGLDWSGRTAQAVRIAQALQNEQARLTPAKTQVLHSAVVAACDGLDGVKDGLIENPIACKFDPGVLVCKGGEEPACLTQPQVDTVRLIYSPIVDAKTKAEIPGLAPGSELGMDRHGMVAIGACHRARSLPVSRLRRSAVGRPEVQRRNRRGAPQRGSERRDRRARSEPQAVLRSWRETDPVPRVERSADHAARQHVAYFNRVAAANGGASKVHASYRLFMAPGMAHCGGGEGPNDFDELTALEQWVEQGKAPDMITASHSRDGKVDRTRPLCPYPQVASYKGSGSIDEAANFVCK